MEGGLGAILRNEDDEEEGLGAILRSGRGGGMAEVVRGPEGRLAGLKI